MNELCIPGVAPLLASGTTPTGEPYFVVASSGQGLEPVLAEGLVLGEVLRIALDGVQVLAALATAGVKLPDARARRFTRDTSGALVLTDIAGASRTAVTQQIASKFYLLLSFRIYL